MSWALPYIQDLKNGKTVYFRPTGRSMEGLIKSRQLCTVEPIKFHLTTLAIDDIVLCKVGISYYLHKISNILSDPINGESLFEISSNRGRINGWITEDGIYGKLVNIED